MQKALSRPPGLTLRGMRARLFLRRPATSLTDAIHRTLSVFARHPASLLACSLLCFGSAGLIGTALYTALVAVVFANNGNFFSAVPPISMAQWSVQAVTGLFTFFLGRGAITWIVQRANAGLPVTTRAAMSAAFVKWKPLLASCLLYGVVISVGMAGLTLFLRDVRMDISNFRWVRNDVSSVINMAVIRSIGDLPPDPGSPFTDLYSAARFQLSRQVTTYAGAYYKYPSRGTPPQIIAAGVFGVLLLVVADTLLCLRSAVIMRADDDDARGWLRQTVSLAVTRFGHVLMWRWTTRIGFAFLTAAFLTLPIALHQGVLVSVLIREVRAYWPYALNSALYSLAAALVGMVAFAFHTAFEAQMLAALSETTN